MSVRLARVACGVAVGATCAAVEMKRSNSGQAKGFESHVAQYPASASQAVVDTANLGVKTLVVDLPERGRSYTFSSPHGQIIALAKGAPAFVRYHEMGHVAYGHNKKKLKEKAALEGINAAAAVMRPFKISAKAPWRTTATGTVASVACFFAGKAGIEVFRKVRCRSFEREADQYARERSTVQELREGEKYFEAARIRNSEFEEDADLSSVQRDLRGMKERILSTHPSYEERIDAIQAEIKKKEAAGAPST